MTVTPIHGNDQGQPPRGASTPAVGLPTPEEIAQWWLRVLGELGRAPFTVYRLRKLSEALVRLPAQIEALIAALERTTDTLEVSLSSMDTRLEDLQATFSGVDARIGNLEATVGELTGNITNLISAIPGARRTLRSTER